MLSESQKLIFLQIKIQNEFQELKMNFLKIIKCLVNVRY